MIGEAEKPSGQFKILQTAARAIPRFAWNQVVA